MSKSGATINGKTYSLWPQFVEKKAEYIGGILEDLDCMFGEKAPATKIVDIVFRPNGTDSAWFGVIGEDYECGGDVKHLGIGHGESGWITFSGYGGTEWRIKPKDKGE